MAPDLQIRSLRTPARPEVWARRIARSEARCPLESLYKGAQWRSSLDLVEELGRVGRSVDVWVVSAGLGLQRASWRGPAYGATFGGGPDQVATTTEGRRAWWVSLSREMRTPSVAAVRRKYDECLIVLSPTYLQVLAPELDELDDDGVAVVTSVGFGHQRERISAGLRHALGGSDATVNPRAARRLAALAGGDPIGSEVANARWQIWAEANAKQVTYDRERMSDSDIKALIDSWRSSGRTSAASLLRRLRDSGLACEQSRFTRLYRECEASS